MYFSILKQIILNSGYYFSLICKNFFKNQFVVDGIGKYVILLASRIFCWLPHLIKFVKPWSSVSCLEFKKKKMKQYSCSLKKAFAFFKLNVFVNPADTLNTSLFFKCAKKCYLRKMSKFILIFFRIYTWKWKFVFKFKE